MKIEDGLKLDFKDVLIRPKRSGLTSRSEVSLERTFHFRNKSWTGIPIFSSNMDTTGTFEMAKELTKKKILTAIHKHYSLEEWKKFKETNENFNYISVSMGISNDDFIKTEEIFKICPDIPFLMLDVANGYSETFVKAVKKARNMFNKIIIAGNVVTREMTEELILAGADCVKVGLSNGSVCSTRQTTGVGYPQLSAILDCADAAHGLNGYIISDGGCRIPADLSKAFGAGADFVMLGGMFAGHYESGGEIIEKNGEKYKLFYGMSSCTAMKKYSGGVAEYRSSEGRTVEVKYKGMVEDTVLHILGGLRSTCTYIGAKNIKCMPKCTTFIRVTSNAENMN